MTRPRILTGDRPVIILGSAAVLVACLLPRPVERADAGCFEDEATVSFQGRTTCFPYDDLPVELRYYIAPDHWRNEDGTPR